MALVLIASMGFTIDFIVRRVTDLGRANVRHVIAVGLHTGDEQSWRRVETAHRLLSTYLNGLGISSELKRVRSSGRLIHTLRDILAYAHSLAGRDDIIEVFLTGGPRILGLALTIAAITSSSKVRNKVYLTSYGETFELSLTIPIGKLISLVSLDPISMSILNEIARLGKAEAGELMKTLQIPKSTLYKKLKELMNAGLIIKEEGAWRVHEELYPLI